MCGLSPRTPYFCCSWAQVCPPYFTGAGPSILRGYECLWQQGKYKLFVFFLKSFHQSLLQHLSHLVMQHKKRKEPLLWKPLPLKGIIYSQMSLVPKGVKSLSAFAFWTGSATGLLPVRMLQTGNKGFCLGLPGSPGRCSRSCPLRSLVGAQGGEELSYVLFVTAVPGSQTLYWILFFFF